MEIYRSTDEGETRQPYAEIEGLPWQPALYELPQEVGEFPAGTVMSGAPLGSALGR